MADNVPTNHLGPAQRASMLSAIQGAGFSMAQEKRLMTLTVPEIKTVLSSQRKSLGAILTRRECDSILADLALTVPHASLAPDQIARKFDIYFGLLQEAGVTFKMLQDAAKRFVMAPNGGKPRFFPDPGQLAEMCGDDIRARRKALAALDKAEAVLIGPVAESDPGAPTPEQLVARMATLKRVFKPREDAPVTEDREPRSPAPNTARASTDAGELLTLIGRKVGKTPDELRRDHPVQKSA